MVIFKCLNFKVIVQVSQETEIYSEKKKQFYPTRNKLPMLQSAAT